tara:strand:+ start:1063 stop:1239 length:177 start_codon:yes stop_codon:yes gene_type:complete
MAKRGELTLTYIIAMILALMVLIVILWIFRAQIMNFVTDITGISSELSSQIDTTGLTE